MLKQNSNRLIETEIRLVAARGEGDGRLDEKGEEIKKYRLVNKT